jgi:hypothetical protein
MDTQLMALGAGGALLAAFVFQLVRSARSDISQLAVSHSWLAEQKRLKDLNE